MSTKTSILALAAAAAFAVAALASTAASAKPIMGVKVLPPKTPILGVPVLPPKPILGLPVHPMPITGIIIHPPGDHDHDHDHDWDGPHFGWWHHFHEPVVVETPVVKAPVVSTPVVTAPVASTPAPCTCLTKSYLQDGSVLFRDVCTKESALATPDELKAQAQN